MSKATSLEYLRELSDSELEHRKSAAAERVETRIKRCTLENRDMTEREYQLSEDDRDELRALREVVEERERAASRREWLGQALDEARAAGIETRQAFAAFTELLKNRAPGRVQVETRAATTTNAGVRTAVDSGTGRPLYVHQLAGIPLQAADALNIEVPYFGDFVARAATAEGGTKPAMADPTLVKVTLGAFASTIAVTDQVVRYGAGLNVIGARLQSEVVYSVNAQTVNDFETEAGTAEAFATSAANMLDTGIALVQERTGNYPSLIVVNPEDWPLLSEKVGRDSAEDIASRVISWIGVDVVANAAQTAGVATVVDGKGWSAFGSPLLLDSMPNLATNTVLARAEQYVAVAPHYSGCAVAVDIITP
ncbi:MAG: hypothetical protein ACM4D3_02520 [Candidatus Sericytochromatia bacterium]